VATRESRKEKTESGNLRGRMEDGRWKMLRVRRGTTNLQHRTLNIELPFGFV
jgi:hypothetical protein